MFNKTFKIIQNIWSVLLSQDKTTVHLEQKKSENFSLEEKSKLLDEYSQNERENRISLSRVTDAQDMMILRRAEELKRKEANCRYSRERWRSLRKKKFQKELCLYLKLKNQKGY